MGLYLKILRIKINSLLNEKIEVSMLSEPPCIIYLIEYILYI